MQTQFISKTGIKITAKQLQNKVGKVSSQIFSSVKSETIATPVAQYDLNFVLPEPETKQQGSDLRQSKIMKMERQLRQIPQIAFTVFNKHSANIYLKVDQELTAKDITQAWSTLNGKPPFTLKKVPLSLSFSNL